MNRVIFVRQNTYCNNLFYKKDVLLVKAESYKLAKNSDSSFLCDTSSIVKYFFTPK